ncbi:hypothetical protein HK436_15220 [Mesorhizobium sediminum]|nr:hypothetical protein [Mesorhizobium sediminum]NRC54922.1 hypothetical protein [Mesorhizobium sediminum]
MKGEIDRAAAYAHAQEGEQRQRFPMRAHDTADDRAFPQHEGESAKATASHRRKASMNGETSPIVPRPNTRLLEKNSGASSMIGIASRVMREVLSVKA